MTVRVNRIHTAVRKAWALLVRDRIVGADRLAFTTFDAFLLINHRPSVFHCDGASWTHLITRMCKTSHALVCHFIPVLWTCIARRRNHLHQRRLIILFINITLLHPLADLYGLILGAQRHTHRKPRALADNLALTVNVIPIR